MAVKILPFSGEIVTNSPTGAFAESMPKNKKNKYGTEN
jgi:hypothetical protein